VCALQSVGVQVLSSWVGLAGDLPQGLYRCSASQMLACRPQDDDGLMLLGTQDEGQGIDLGVADAFLKVSQIRSHLEYLDLWGLEPLPDGTCLGNPVLFRILSLWCTARPDLAPLASTHRHPPK
jgi:hypothetical protein